MRLKDSYDLEANLEMQSNDFKKTIFTEKPARTVSPLEKYRKK